jgi:hypothetical protein
MLVNTTEIIFEKDIFDWIVNDMNYFTISLDELNLIFRKLIEALNYPRFPAKKSRLWYT